MTTKFKYLVISAVLSIVVGCIGTGIIANNENGYVAGFVVLPAMGGIGVFSLIFIVSWLVNMSEPSGPSFLLATLLIPASGTASLAMMDANGKKRVLIEVKPDGTPSMTFLDANGKSIGRFPAK